MDLDEFKRIIDPLATRLFGISLSLRGEPLLGKDILPMIEYAHSRRIAVSFPSNLSLSLSVEKQERLVRSGLDVIFVSLDGASEQTYSQYRVGGQFDLVLRNVKSLALTKKRLGLKRPRLIWKFVTFEHNKHELPTVVAKHREWGFDDYELDADFGAESARKARRDHNADLVTNKKGCYWAWHTAVIRADGEVAACCLGHEPFGLGNVKEQDLLSIWRGQAYAKLRAGFDTMRPEDLNPVCRTCLLGEQQPLQ